MKIPQRDVLNLTLQFARIVEAPDTYYPNIQRFRRYGELGYVYDKWKITNNTGVFYQSTEFNPYLGGVSRKYEPLLEEHVEDESFQNVVSAFASTLPKVYNSIEVHAMRVVTGMEPTVLVPEGIHQDGYDHLGVVCVDRNNIEGAVLSLYTDKQGINTVLETPLEPGQLFSIDDKKLWHYATPMYAKNESLSYIDFMVLLVKDESESENKVDKQ